MTQKDAAKLAEDVPVEVMEAVKRFKQHPAGLYTEIALDLRDLSKVAIAVIEKLEGK